jgi:DNA invertase Pin-like site-specific DNA recombinase
VQREALRLAGVRVIFVEKTRGMQRDGRTDLQKVLSVVGEADALVVIGLDGSGAPCATSPILPTRSSSARAHLKVIEQSLDTSSAAERAFYGMLAVFAAFATDGRRAPQLEGIAVAKRHVQPRPGACTGCSNRRAAATQHEQREFSR